MAGTLQLCCKLWFLLELRVALDCDDAFLGSESILAAGSYKRTHMLGMHGVPTVMADAWNESMPVVIADAGEHSTCKTTRQSCPC